MENLPVEILLKIFKYQSSTVELKKIALVCRRWKTIVEEYLNLLERLVLKSNLMNRFINKNFELKNPEQLVPLIRQYKYLSLTGSDLETVAPFIQNLELKYLELKNMKFAEASTVLEKYKDTLEFLEVRTMVNCSSDIKSLCKIDTLRYVKVTLAGIADIDFLKMIVLNNLKSVRNLELMILGFEFDPVFIGRLINLKTFKITFRGISYEFLLKFKNVIGKLRSLENLTLGGMKEIFLDKFIFEIRKLPLLKKFELEQFEYKFDNDNRGVVKDNVLKKEIPYLTKFCGYSIDCSYEICYSTTIFKPYLTELSLSARLLDVDFSALVRNCPFVEHFKLELLGSPFKEYSIDKIFLENISKGWSKLKTFYLQAKWKLSNNTESSIIVFPNLISLHLEYFEEIKTLFNVIRTPNLQNLSIKGPLLGNFYDQPHNRLMLENLKTISTPYNNIPGSFPYANYMKMKLDLRNVITFLKNLKSKSLNCDLEIYDPKYYSPSINLEWEVLNYFRTVAKELNLTVYDFFLDFEDRRRKEFIGILSKDGVKFCARYECYLEEEIDSD